jgi:hypothetical protein
VRLLDQVGNVAEETTADGAVGDAMVEHQRELHHAAWCQPAGHDPGPFGDPPHPEDGDLGRIDERGAAVDAERAEIGDGERAAAEL